MAWPSKLVLVRHAESAGNVRTAEERAAYEVPTHAYPLTETGRRQAELTGEWLRAAYGDFDVYYTSYYERAKETLLRMYPEAKRYEDARLAEANRGIYHTYTKAEIERHFPKELERKEREGLYHHRPIGGENWPDIELRIHSFLGTLARDCGGQKVLIVVHGFWLILFQKLVHRFPIEEALQRYAKAVAPNASVTAYDGVEGDWADVSYRQDGTEIPARPKPRLLLEREHFVPWGGKL